MNRRHVYTSLLLTTITALTVLLVVPISATLLPVHIGRAAPVTRQVPNSAESLESSINSLTASSDMVIRGQVQSQVSFWNDDRTLILTDSHIDVRYSVAGPPVQAVTVRTLGGQLPGEGIGMGTTHVPELHEDEEVLLYLQADGDHLTISQGEAGKFVVTDMQARNEHLNVAVPLIDLLTTTDSVLPENWKALESQALTTAGSAPDTVENYVYDGVHWPGDQPVIPFHVNPQSAQSGAGDGDQTAFLNAILSAAATWSDAATASFSFSYAGSISQRTVSQNGINEIVFIDKGTGEGTVGQTRYWYTVPAKEVVEADVWFNDAYDLDASGVPGGSEIDLQSVALHEFGHWLVLGHDDDVAAIMYYAISAGTMKRSLYQTDTNGISAIYPCSNFPCGSVQDPDPTATPNNTPTPTNTPTFTPTPSPTLTATPLPAATFTPTLTPEPPGTIPPTSEPTLTPTPKPSTDTPEVHEVSTEGGSVTFGDGEAGLIVDIPADAVNGTVALAYLENPEPTQASGTNLQFAGVGFNLDAAREGVQLDGLNFNLPVTFAMTYPDQAGMDEEDLALFYFDIATQSWQPASCGATSLDATTNEFSVEVCHLTEFALFSEETDTSSRVFMPVVRR